MKFYELEQISSGSDIRKDHILYTYMSSISKVIDITLVDIPTVIIMDSSCRA